MSRKPPGAALPRAREVDLRRVARQPARRDAEVLLGDLDRARQPRRRRLGQQAHRVAPERRRVLVARPVVVVHRVGHDAGLALALERERHRAAEQRRLAPDERVLVRVDRVVVGRDEVARAVRAHLVHREEHLRVPHAREEVRQRAALRHVQHEHVAVDVVADVLVVRPRHRAAFERRSRRLPVPVGHEHVAVRVQRRDQDDDDPVEHRDGALVARRRQLVEQFVRRLRRADLARVDAAPDGDHGARAGEDRLRLALVGQAARVGEQPVVDLQVRRGS